jgi:hypothetical protein
VIGPRRLEHRAARRARALPGPRCSVRAADHRGLVCGISHRRTARARGASAGTYGDTFGTSGGVAAVASAAGGAVPSSRRLASTSSGGIPRPAEPLCGDNHSTRSRTDRWRPRALGRLRRQALSGRDSETEAAPWRPLATAALGQKPPRGWPRRVAAVPSAPDIVALAGGALLSCAEQQKRALLATLKDGVGVISSQGISKRGPVDFLRARRLTIVTDR